MADDDWTVSKLLKVRASYVKKESALDLLGQLLVFQEELSAVHPAAFRLNKQHAGSSEGRIWPVMLNINREWVMSLIFRTIYLIMSTHKISHPAGPGIEKNRDRLARSATITLGYFEELLAEDLLKYSHSFMYKCPFVLLSRI